MAADRIRVGEADVMIAGGIESMSIGAMMGHHPSMNLDMFSDENIGMAYGMGLTAEKVAQQWKVSREQQDAFSVESHRRAIAAQQAGFFKAETTPVESSRARRTWPPAKSMYRAAPSTPTKARAPIRRWSRWANSNPCLPPRAPSRPRTARRCPTAPVRC